MEIQLELVQAAEVLVRHVLFQVWDAGEFGERIQLRHLAETETPELALQAVASRGAGAIYDRRSTPRFERDADRAGERAEVLSSLEACDAWLKLAEEVCSAAICSLHSLYWLASS